MIVLLVAFGSIILFLSWVFDNYFHNKWDEKGKELDYNRTFLASEVIYKDIIKEVVNHYAILENPNPNTVEAFKHALYKYSQTVIVIDQITSKMMAIDEGNYSKEWLHSKLKSGDSMLAVMQNTWRNLSLNEMMSKSVEMESQYYLTQGQNIATVNKYRQSLFDKSEHANKLFLICYIVGSLILALAFIIKQTDKTLIHDKKVRKYSNHPLQKRRPPRIFSQNGKWLL